MMKFTGILAMGLLASSAWAGNEQDVQLTFSGAAHDMEHDAARGRVYVSIPSQDKVVVVDTNTWQVQTEVSVAPSPHGLSLSIDGTRLFVAKSGSGSVAVIDPDTWLQSEIPLTGSLGDARTYDVIEAQSNRLYVSSDPGSGGFAYIVQVELDNANLATRVANQQIIRCEPTFEVSPDRSALYVGECFSPNSVYKLDLTQASAPIVAEDAHGSVSGSFHLESSLDGSRLHLASGQILDANSLSVVGQVGPGVSRFDTDPTRIFVVAAPNQIQTWSVVSQTSLTSRTLNCTFSQVRELLVMPGEQGFLVLADSQLCGVAQVAPCVAQVQSLCGNTPNSAGPGAKLTAMGEPRVSLNNFGLSVQGAPAGRSLLFVFGKESAQLPFGDGWLCVSPFPGIHQMPNAAPTDGNGLALRMLDLSSGVLPNGAIAAYSTWYFQAWYRDPGGPGGTDVNTTDALRVTFCP